jgi:hypothetical protein
VSQWGCDGPYSGVYAAPAAVFRLSFLGSVEVDEDSRRRKKRPKKNMVEEAVTKIKVSPENYIIITRVCPRNPKRPRIRSSKLI